MSEIVGLKLDSFTETLVRVDEQFNNPRGDDSTAWQSFDVWEAVGPHARRYAEAHFVYPEGSPLPPFSKVASSMPMRALARLSFDQLCKVQFSSLTMLDRSVTEQFERDSSDPAFSHEHRLVHKIESSMWRWGMGRSTWNDLVEARENIIGFDFGIPGFEIRLDHTTYVNECGYSEYSRTYLDGALAYLVYFRGEHVMTIGFSVMDKRRLLIQQVQLKNRRGNRFLFRMPKNRVEHVIGCFRKAFAGWSLFLVDGGDVAMKALKSYESAHKSTLERLGRQTRSVVAIANKGSLEAITERDQWEIDYHIRLQDEEREFKARIAHIKTEIDRIRDFYANIGSYQIADVEPLQMNRLNHYALAA